MLQHKLSFCLAGFGHLLVGSGAGGDAPLWGRTFEPSCPRRQERGQVHLAGRVSEPDLGLASSGINLAALSQFPVQTVEIPAPRARASKQNAKPRTPPP